MSFDPSPDLPRTGIAREEVLQAFDVLLQPERFKDYGPNGLQVEGKPLIRKIVSGVTASRALIEAAIAAQADAVFVHHGLFWRGQDGRVTGWMKQRLALLLAHDINLFAYHLPLDAHPVLGNNAQLGEVLGLSAEGRFGDQELGFLGGWADGREPVAALALVNHLENRLHRPVVSVIGSQDAIKRVAWCSGGSAGLFRGRHRFGRPGLHHRRNFRTPGASGTGMWRELSCLRAPCDRALWRACRRGPRGGATRTLPRIH